VTTIQFEQDGDVVTADGDGFITIYSVDSDGAYFVRMEFEVQFSELLRDVTPCRWVSSFAGLLDTESEGNKSL
jgi:hypothetical protein